VVKPVALTGQNWPFGSMATAGPVRKFAQTPFPEESMRHVRLITTAIALSIPATGLSAINAAEQQLNPKGITIKLPDQIPWTRNAASAVVTAASNETAVLYGDPTKSGTYVYRSKFAPGSKNMPHWHPEERTVAILSGTLYYGLGEQWDESKLIALPAGTFLAEPPKTTHFTWAKEGEVILQVTGIGPTGTTLVPPPKP
jgi:quercetin dioxygenase-like cupin family protein